MKTKWPPHWIYYASIGYISAKTQSLVLMKAYLWSTNDGKASWTVNALTSLIHFVQLCNKVD